MKRRQFLGVTIPGLLSLSLFSASLFGWGRVDIQRHLELRHKGIWLRVFFNGHDVTKDCVEADDQMGSIELLLRNERGQHYAEYAQGEWRAAREFKHGHVEFKQVEPWG